MKKGKMIWLAVIAALVLAPTLCAAEMYVGLYGGINFTSNDSYNLRWAGQSFRASSSGNWEPAFLGGFKIGTWFVKEGFLGYNYPEWMKYLGFEFDFGYNRLSVQNTTIGTNLGNTQAWQRAMGSNLLTNFQRAGAMTYSNDGECLTFAFMFMGRYGFLADQDVPFGRLQPYVGVGPAIFVTNWSPQLAGYSLGSSTQTNIGLAAEAGLRYMALKNVSLLTAFRYRFTSSGYSGSSAWLPQVGGTRISSNNIGLNQFSFIFGAAYHF